MDIFLPTLPLIALVSYTSALNLLFFSLSPLSGIVWVCVWVSRLACAHRGLWRWIAAARCSRCYRGKDFLLHESSSVQDTGKQKSQTMTNCVLLMNHRETTQEGRQKRYPSPWEDVTSGMLAHRAPHSSFWRCSCGCTGSGLCSFQTRNL